ncbi:MAG: inositol monophosphatase [Gammaproteobacteria bacterium]|nr:inositol monophosphatase [Gammaproteobacteria bacterium]
MHPILNIAVKAARRAGTVIVRYIDHVDRLEVTEKGRNDFVSEVDEIAESEIINVIKTAYPDHAIVAEESGKKTGRQYEWVIDPLDGTTNFLHGHPVFAVSIAVRQDSEIRHAVIFDPLRNELFTASRGSGAHLNNHRIRVSRVIRMRSALLGTGFPFKHLEHLDTWMATFKVLLRRSSGIRRAGSAALDLAYVACGRFDGFWEMGLKEWDMAAGCLLVQEAGGLVSDFAGRQDYLVTGNIVAGNPAIHPELLDIIRDKLPAN